MVSKGRDLLRFQGGALESSSGLRPENPPKGKSPLETLIILVRHAITRSRLTGRVGPDENADAAKAVDDLSDTDYRPLPGTDPQQYMAASAEVDPVTLPVLDELRGALTGSPGLNLALIGHTDNGLVCSSLHACRSACRRRDLTGRRENA